MASYTQSLDNNAKTRYLLKLKVFGNDLPDPYGMNKWTDKMNDWPDLLYGDIYEYLVNSENPFATKDQMKSFKSLEAYNYFLSGHVQIIYFHKISKSSPVCFLKSSVKSSQRTDDETHDSWVCLEKKTATIISAHCTCQAGLGEACSHVAALLFKVESTVRLGLTTTACTSNECKWNNNFKKTVQCLPIEEINFSKFVHGKTKGQKRKHEAKSRPTFKPLAPEKMKEMMKKLALLAPNASIILKSLSDTDTASEDEETITASAIFETNQHD